MSIVRPGTYNWGTITTPAAGSYTLPVVDDLKGMQSITWFMNFVRTSGGTTAKYWLQISPDAGTSWIDIANMAFTTSTLLKLHHIVNTVALTNTTPVTSALGDNTILAGITGDRLRIAYTLVGTYVGTFQSSVVVS